MPSPRALVLALFAVAVAAPPAYALDWDVRVEPGLAFPMTDPQSTRYGVGGGVAVKAGLAPIKMLDLNLSLHDVFFSAKGANDAGGGFAVGGGARFQYRSELFFTPWIDGDVLFVSTGGVGALGFSMALGVSFAVGPERRIGVGPFLRYLHIHQGDDVGHDSGDAKLLLFGVSLEYGTPHPNVTNLDADNDGIPDAVDPCPMEPEDKDGFEDVDGCPEIDNDHDGIFDDADKCPNVKGPRSAGGCPDQDSDGIADKDDRCPEVAGPADNQGCPKNDSVKITGNKLDLRDKIFFSYDKAEILPKSFAILNDVVAVLKDNPTIRIRIEGHTDDSGRAAHNLSLSSDRATSVRQYLISNGTDPNRLEAQGYGATQPLESNKTADGRERNRRVEFVIISK